FCFVSSGSSWHSLRVMWASGGPFVPCFFFFSSRRRHTRFSRDWSSDVCSSDLKAHETTRIVCGSAVVAPERSRLDGGHACRDRRSEERRVGKECRCRWPSERYKKNRTPGMPGGKSPRTSAPAATNSRRIRGRAR